MRQPSEYQGLSPALLAEFSAGAGHDLNNPLAAISGRVQLMLRVEDDPVKREDLSVILTQVRRAQDMIAGLRLIACPPRPEKKELLINAFLDAFFQRESVRLQEQNVTWEIRQNGKSDGVIYADEVQLSVLFQELLKNALRALGGAGDICVEWCLVPENKVVEIHFRDSGSGIPLEIRPYIFDPYYSSYQSGRGLGFGLTKARIIAQLHGGDVILEECEQQTTFLVTLKI